MRKCTFQFWLHSGLGEQELLVLASHIRYFVILFLNRKFYFSFEKVSGTPTWARLRWERTEQLSEGTVNHASSDMVKRMKVLLAYIA